MNKLKSTRIYGDLYIDGLAKVNSNDIITTTNLSSTIQTASPNSLTTTENRSYSIQRNASGQLVVNIPWTDTTTNTYPTTFTWTGGTSGGPTGSLTGENMAAVPFAAIPSASNTASGVVTTDEQTFKGKKTFTDNVTLSGDLTVLGAMNVKNVNVLETSSGIIFEGGSGSGKVTMELATDPGTTSYSLKVPNKNGTIATDDIMTNTTLGLGKLFSDTVQSVAASTVSSTASRTYGIQRNSANQLVVNVPWEDNITYSAGNGLTLSGSTFSLPVSTSGTGTFVTGITQLTNGIQVNLGTPPDTNTHRTSKNVVSGSSTASTDGVSTNGNTYINHIETGLSSPTSSHNIVGTGATTVTSDVNGKITIHSEDTNTTYVQATTSALGLVKLGVAAATATLNSATTTASRFYRVGALTTGEMYVNVPWTDTDTIYTLPLAANGTRGGLQIGYTENGKNYPVKLSSEKAFVSVPWTDTVYTHPAYPLTTAAGTETTLTDITLIDSLTTNSTGHLTGATWRKLVAGSNVTITPTANGNITINSTDTNTVYTHPTYAGDDIDLDTGPLTGATVISDLDFNITTDTLGHVTDANATYSTRALTLADLGYVAPTINNGQLSLTTSGVGLSGSGTFTANQSGNTTFTVTSNATDQPTASTIVARDSSGDVRAASKFYYGSNAYTAYNSTDESIDFVFIN